MNPVSYGLDSLFIENCKNSFKIDKDISILRDSNIEFLNNEKKYVSKIDKYLLPKELYSIEKNYMDVYLFYPENNQNNNFKHSVIYFLHGGGFVFDGFKKLPRELSNRTNSIVIYPDYALAPENKYPLGLKQIYQLFLDIMAGSYKPYDDMDIDTISIVGESAGGNLSFTLSLMLVLNQSYTLLSRISKILSINPVTNNDFTTSSYNKFGNGFFLTTESMKWFINHYLNDEKDANEITCFPSKASPYHLSKLPETMIITAECDVLCDEAEEFALNLKKVNVKVSLFRFIKTIHGFVSADPLDKTRQCKVAMDLSTSYLNNSDTIESVINENNNKLFLKLI